MLYSYRHPDIGLKVVTSSKATDEARRGTEDFKERRQSVRLIPVAAVVQSTDSDAWSLWDQAVEDGSGTAHSDNDA